MRFKKADPLVGEHLEHSFASYDVEKRRMFGHPVYFVNNNMFAGLYGKDIFLRLSQDDQERLMNDFDEAHPFAPMNRPMREYVIIPDSIHEDSVLFNEWIERSYKYVQSLPPKVKKR